MMKLNQTTHILILFTFVIIFVGFYLYHTIADVKRLNVEVKKLTTDLQNIANGLSNISKELSEVRQCDNQTCSIQQVPLEVTQTTIKSEQEPKVVINKILENEDDDDSSSVNTEELKKIINDDVEEEDEEEQEEDEIFEEIIKSEPQFTHEELDKKKLPEIKDLCRLKGLETKGTKEQLISKLLSI